MGMLKAQRRTWLVTGAAGFIGSHLVERLLGLEQRVIALDNFSTGTRANLEAVRSAVAPEKAALLTFFEQDIRDREGLIDLLTKHVPDVILHQAALGSVPRSIADPLTSHQVNVDGFVHILEAARTAKVQRIVYASSSSVYGDIGGGQKSEGALGSCLSPYAVTKRTNELYAQVYGRTYGMETVGLRYFNVFGPRQDPQGQYAAVIPRWLEALSRLESPVIFGDGSTSRDFCYVANVVQANLLAASAGPTEEIINSVVNVGCGTTTTLVELLELLRRAVASAKGLVIAQMPAARFEPFRAGDVQHSLADITFAMRALGYEPTYSVAEGITELVKTQLSAGRLGGPA